MPLGNGNGSPRRIRVLGVDPASAGPTGFGVVEVEGCAARPLRFGALKLPARSDFPWRLREIHRLIAALVDEFSPDAVAVEAVFNALNVSTTVRLAEVRGVVLLAAAQASIPSHSYSPREVKASIAGYGNASKQQMQQMVSVQLGLREYPEPADAADALAVALCHAHITLANERMAAAMAPRGISPYAAEPSARTAAASAASGERNASRIVRIVTTR